MTRVRITGEVLEYYKERARQEQAKAFAEAARWAAAIIGRGLRRRRRRASGRFPEKNWRRA